MQLFEQSINCLYHGTLQSQLEINMELICQKSDLYYAEALNSILPKQSITHLFIYSKNTTVEDQGIITSLSLSPTVVYQNIMFNGNTSPPIQGSEQINRK